MYFCTILFSLVMICVAFMQGLHSLHSHITTIGIKNKHFWLYTKYNNICLNYEKHGWPKSSSPM